MIPLVSVVAMGLAAAINGYCKWRVAREALRDVPAKKRADVVDALGRLYGRW